MSLGGLRAAALAALCTLAAAPCGAETAVYGRIELTGLSRDTSWPLNPPGLRRAMVCEVNGPDGFLAIRSGPGTDREVVRRLGRLAKVTVDTGQRRGNWIRVTGAHRDHDPDGVPQQYAPLPVTGWAHDDHLCAFLD